MSDASQLPFVSLLAYYVDTALHSSPFASRLSIELFLG